MDDGPDGAVETTWPESKSLTNVLEKEIAVYLSFECNLSTLRVSHCCDKMAAFLTEHAWGNVDTTPDVAFLIENFAGKS
jgi:hypothetical protein